MKKIISVAALATLFAAGNALAVPVFTMDEGNGFAINLQEDADWESTVFAYNVADRSDRVMLFDDASEPGDFVFFQDSDWGALTTGFTFAFVSNGEYVWDADSSQNQLVDGTPFDVGVEHVQVASLFSNSFAVGVEDLPSQWADWDVGSYGVYKDMTFSISGEGLAMTDVAPVPEPATILLFGTGIVGLAGNRIRRQKKQKA